MELHISKKCATLFFHDCPNRIHALKGILKKKENKEALLWKKNCSGSIYAWYCRDLSSLPSVDYSPVSGFQVFLYQLGRNVGGKNICGIQNYIDLFKDADFRSAWWFTIKFTIGNTIIQNVAALLFAVALDSGIKAQKVYRTAFFCTVSDQCGNCGFCVAENVLKCIAGD